MARQVLTGAVSLLAILLAWGLAGCDRRPSAPPQSPTAQASEETAAATQPATRPTTQELLQGPYSKLPLPGLPLSVSVPAGWKIESMGPATFLAGPTPTDEGRIQISHGDINTFKPDQIDMLLTRAKKEMADDPQRVKKAELRSVGQLKVLETLAFSRPVTSPKMDPKGLGVLDDKGELVTVTTTPVHWTLLVFIPQGGAFARVELNFIDLTGEQLAQDQPVLQKIVDSLTYEPSLASPPSAGAP
ncbi:MAG TPA: hypothetical protein VH518_12685 [Tepidisphaeraceae bacterium]|jgi:hypothetical protein